MFSSSQHELFLSVYHVSQNSIAIRLRESSKLTVITYEAVINFVGYIKDVDLLNKKLIPDYSRSQSFFSKIDPDSLPVRVRYGITFVASVCDLCSTLIPTLVYSTSCCTRLCIYHTLYIRDQCSPKFLLA